MLGDRRRLLAVILIILLFAVLAVLFTRPIAWKAGTEAVKHVSDPPFQAWTLDWDVRALLSNPFNLFNANIFYPNKYTLAYSDHQITNAILAMPFLGLTHNPMLAHNIVLIINFFLCSLGAYLLAVHLTKNRIAGVVAGVAFAYAPYKLAHIFHLNLCTAAYIPLTLLFLHRYAEEKKTSDAFLCALFFTLQALSTWHYGFMLAIAVVIFVVLRLLRDRMALTLKWLGFLALAFVCALVVVVPFARPYLVLQKEDPSFKRNISEVEVYSADVSDFLVAPGNNFIWGKLTAGMREDLEVPSKRAGADERALFPGLMPLLLGIAGVVYIIRRGGREERFSLWFYGALIVVAFILCLGVSLYLFGHRFGLPMPYRLLYYFFPGFKAMRVPARFDILIVLALAVLSAYGTKGILSWLSHNESRFVSAALAALLVALVLLDLASTGQTMEKIPLKRDFPPVYYWLRDQPGESPTAEIPIPPFPEGIKPWVELDSMRTYFSTLHWKKIFNGYSGFIPETIVTAGTLLKKFPDSESVAYLKSKGIKFLIVHGDEMDAAFLNEIKNWTGTHTDLIFVASFKNDYVYRIK